MNSIDWKKEYKKESIKLANSVRSQNIGRK